MFKDLFPKRFNRLLYKNPEGMKAPEQTETVSQMTPEQEAEKLGDAIDRYMEGIQEERQGNEFWQNEYDQIIARLESAKEELKKNPTRTTLDNVRTIWTGAVNIHHSMNTLPEDPAKPLRTVRAERVEKSETKAVHNDKTKPSPSETPWLKMANLVEEYMNAKSGEKARLASSLIQLAKTNMGALENRDYAVGDTNLLVQKAKGKDAYLFVLGKPVNNESAAKSRHEFVIVGEKASESDFKLNADQMIASYQKAQEYDPTEI